MYQSSHTTLSPQLEHRADGHQGIDGQEEGDEEEAVGNEAADPVGVLLAQKGVQVALYICVCVHVYG